MIVAITVFSPVFRRLHKGSLRSLGSLRLIVDCIRVLQGVQGSCRGSGFAIDFLMGFYPGI